MSNPITIEDLDSEILARLQAEASRRGCDLNAAARQLLEEGLRDATDAPAQCEVTDLAGTWSDEETDEFLSAIADFERIDPELWT